MVSFVSETPPTAFAAVTRLTPHPPLPWWLEHEGEQEERQQRDAPK
jgi:hypothetical protein